MSKRSQRRALVALLVVAAVAIDVWCRFREPSSIVVVRAEGDSIGWVAAIVNILASLWGRGKGQSVDLGTKMAIDGMRTDMSNSTQTLSGAIANIAGQVAATMGVVKRMIAKVFNKLYQMLKALIEKIVRLLQRVFGPIINFLRKIKIHLYDIYEHIIKPILEFIEKVRAVLKLLGYFGVDWAKKLDTKLAQVEQYVLAPYEFLVNKINEVSNWINKIVTLDGLFQRVMLLNSLLRDVGYTNNLWWNSQLDPANALKPKPGSGPGETDPSKVVGEMRAHLATGNAPISGAIRESIANVNINLKRST